MENRKKFKDDTGRILIGTTFISAFLDENACPKQLYHQYILEDAFRRPTESMILGNYFEALALGSTSKGETAASIEVFISKTTKGEKKVDQQRIEMQAANFIKFCETYKIEVQEVQVPAYVPLDENVSIGTVLDIVATVDDPVYGKVDAVIDLKLTKDLDNDYGAYQWKEPHLRDHTQAFMGVYLAKRALNIANPKFYYAVFSYGPETDSAFIEKVVTDVDIYELQETTNKTIKTMRDFHAENWVPRSSYEKCSKCPLAGNCSQNIKIKPIIRV